MGLPGSRRASRARVAAGVVGVLAAALAGCTSSETTPADAARASVASLLVACEDRNGEAALALVTPPLRATVLDAGSVTAGCAQVLGLAPDSGLAAEVAFGRASIENVRVDDQHGSAVVDPPYGDSSELELEQLGGEWRVAGPL